MYDNYRQSLTRLKNRNIEFSGQDETAQLEQVMAESRFSYGVVFFLTRLLKKSMVFNITAIVIVAFVSRKITVPASGSRIFLYGHTENNRKAFKRLIRFAITREKSYEINGRKGSFVERFFTVLNFRRVILTANCAKHAGTAGALSHIQLLISLSYFLFLSCNTQLLSKLRAVVLANDHSPLPIALWQASKDCNIMTVYVQHAPISRIFPPLRFDYAVLNDRYSLNLYRAIDSEKGIAENPTATELLPIVNRANCPIRRASEPFTVGICLSLFPNLRNTRKFALDILANSAVDRLIIKHHPRSRDVIFSDSICGIEEIKHDPGMELFWKRVDFCFVSNSGVGLELLCEGIPTFYVSTLDDFIYDYYGFVELQVMPEFNDRLWSKDPESLLAYFDEGWRKRFSQLLNQESVSGDEVSSKISKVFWRISSS